MSIFLLGMITSSVFAGPVSRASAVGPVTYVVGQDTAPYRIHIGGRNDFIPLVFEFPCHTRPEVTKSHFAIQFLRDGRKTAAEKSAKEEGGEFIAFARLVREAERGYDAIVPVVCEGPIVVPIHLVVTTPGQRTAEARFRLSTEQSSHIATAKEAARLERSQQCDHERRQDALRWQSQLQQQVLRASRGAFVARSVRRTAQSEHGNWVVYVTRVKRLGHYAMVEFEVENLLPEPLHLASVEVEAKGSDFRQSRALAVERHQLDGEEQLPSQATTETNFAAGQAPMEVVLGTDSTQQTSLDPAERVWGSVMFSYPWPTEAPGAVNLTLKSTSADFVLVNDIPFPRGEK